MRLVKNVFLEIDHRYTPINTDNTDGSFMGGWVVGSNGLQLMPQIEQISDLSSLKAILRNVIAANTLEEVQL
ncbi:hypothetical protein FIS3754_19780 [Fischerella sp. NIES-3754]|nr:hypothetical protein FIS3754_19780 [Fischerella sp. NIES-3754]BCX08351.1 MAG: hypothetical protein KatS3mg066_2210 [Fischerella sp.]